MPPRSSSLRDLSERPSQNLLSRHPEAGQKRKSKPSRNRLIVGIDYGTAHTSVAYSYVPSSHETNPRSLGARLEKVQLIVKWPGGLGTAFVPTVTMYDSAAVRHETPNLPKWWGCKVQKVIEKKEAPNTAHAVHLAKLILHESKETKAEADRLRVLAYFVGRKEVDLITDFLRQLHDYLLGDKGYFKDHHAAWLDDTNIEFVFGIPAAWSVPEQQAMVQAAMKAGFDNPLCCSEPEAMAASYFAQHETSLEVGETFVICDAGGGTVDLTTYTITELNPLRVNEASVAEGVLCGSIFLNRRLRDLLDGILKSERYLSNRDRILNDIIKDFEEGIKPEFDGTQDESFFVPGLRADRKRGFKKDKILLSSDQLRTSVFDPVVDQIVQIIRKQVESSRAIAHKAASLSEGHANDNPLKIKNIVLGGGFSDNPYLYNAIKSAFSQNINPEDNISIQRVSTVGPAVSQGLVVIASKEGLVRQRRSQLSYGLVTYLDYNKYEHGTRKAADAKWDKFDRKGMNVKAIDWLIHKGQQIPLEINLPTREREWNVNENNNGVKMVVYATDFEPKEEITLMVDFLKKDPETVQSYELDINFPPKPMNEIFEERRGKSGGAFYMAKWDVSLNVKGNQMVWSATLKLKNGERRTTVYERRAIDATEASTKILGSLASRVRPVRPRSNLSPEPATPRKRRRGRNGEASQREALHLPRYCSPHDVESDPEFQPPSAWGDSDAKSITIGRDDDIYEDSD